MQRSVSHATFVIERAYKAPPAKVFAAFANPKSKARWFVGPDDWEKSDHKLDFRVGGKESVSGGPPGGVVHSYNATIWDIVEGERIVASYEMHMDKTRISVSVGHFGHFFVEDDRWWSVFGRLAAPTFFFLLGYAQTRTVPLHWIWLGVILHALAVAVIVSMRGAPEATAEAVA